LLFSICINILKEQKHESLKNEFKLFIQKLKLNGKNKSEWDDFTKKRDLGTEKTSRFIVTRGRHKTLNASNSELNKNKNVIDKNYRLIDDSKTFSTLNTIEPKMMRSKNFYTFNELDEAQENVLIIQSDHLKINSDILRTPKDHFSLKNKSCDILHDSDDSSIGEELLSETFKNQPKEFKYNSKSHLKLKS
jgi:hypothetical protein